MKTCELQNKEDYKKSILPCEPLLQDLGELHPMEIVDRVYMMHDQIRLRDVLLVHMKVPHQEMLRKFPDFLTSIQDMKDLWSHHHKTLFDLAKARHQIRTKNAEIKSLKYKIKELTLSRTFVVGGADEESRQTSKRRSFKDS